MKAARTLLVVIGLCAVVLAIYWQAGGHAFINFDDKDYVYENRRVLQGLSPESVRWAFATFHTGNWHPLTWLSHMTDVTLFGPSPGAQHRTNVLLHLLNTCFLFLVLRRMTGALWPSALVAALFGAHPLHVESVAWVSERKDVLCTFFWLLTMAAYLRYARKPGVSRYLLVVATFSLSLLSKPMPVTLPFVLLLLDWWPLDRLAGPAISRRILEKLPLAALSAASCVVTYIAQSGGGLVAPSALPFSARLSTAAVSYAFYLAKTVWPSGLAMFYPSPWFVGAAIPAWQLFGAVLLLAALSVLAVLDVRRRPFLAAGWFWYLGTLVPVIGLVQVGDQAAADRYTYVPLIGVFIAVAWGVPALASGKRVRRVAAGLLAAAVAALSVAAHGQAGYWRDSVSLFSRTLAVTQGNWRALNCLGLAYSSQGRFQEAIGYFTELNRIAPPKYADGWNNLGVVYGKAGRLEDAIGCFRHAVGIDPGYAEAWNNLGVAYDRLGDTPQAAACFLEAVRLKPDNAGMRGNLELLRGRPAAPR